MFMLFHYRRLAQYRFHFFTVIPEGRQAASEVCLLPGLH